MARKLPRRRKGLVHKAPKNDYDVHSEINVTPLVDVCLVLLVIFMVIAPLLARGKEIKLPQTKFHSSQKDTHQPIVAVDAKGKVYFDKDIVAQMIPREDVLPDSELPRWKIDKPKELQRKLEDAWDRLAEQGITDDEGLPVGRRVFLKAHPDLDYGRVYPVIMAIHELGLASIDLGTHELKEKQAE